MEAERESSPAGRLEQLMSDAPPGFVQVILGVMDDAPPDRIVLVNPVTQEMVVLQDDPAVVAEILSGRGVSGGQPPASKASIEAMGTVDVGGGEGEQQEECPVCLDGLGGSGVAAAATVVREMPCGHRFHEGCIIRWLGMHGSCPVCRFRMPAEGDGSSKKGDGEGDTNERRRRRRGLWVSIVYSRPMSMDQDDGGGEDGGGGDGEGGGGGGGGGDEE